MNLHDEMSQFMNAQISAAFGLSTSQIEETRPPLTADSLMAQMRALPLERFAARLDIIFTATALEATAERLFPASRHRSARIRKKLIKRFGGEFRMKPTIWKLGNVIYAHPLFESRFRSVSLEVGRAA